MARSRKNKKHLNNSKTNLMGEEIIEEEEKDCDDNDEGETNLGYVSEASDIIKPKSKEDVRTIRRNLSKSKGDSQKKKVTKKKALTEDDTESVTIKNKLFEDKNKDDLTVSTGRRRKSRNRHQPRAEDEERIEMADIHNHEEENENTLETDERRNESRHSDREDLAQNEQQLGTSAKKRSARSKTKKKQNVEEIKRTEQDENLHQSSPVHQRESLYQPQNNKPGHRRVFGVFVHYSDCLKLNLHVMHPLVKVSIVNLESGELVSKSNRRQKVSSYYETENVKNVVPLMTQPFEFRHRKSIVPRWEELLLFNDDFDYFVALGPKLGVFFEILDFVSMSAVTNNQIGKATGQGGWHHVAWSFLKPVPSKSYSNIGKRVRLQMYKPGITPNISSKLSFARSVSAPDGRPENRNISTPWYWWSKCQHVTYPSSLYVTVEPIAPPMIETVQPALRSMTAAQPEYGSTMMIDRHIHDDEPNEDIQRKKGDSLGNDNLPRVVLWTRLPGQTCKIPDQNIFSVETLTKGARCIVFSSDGRYLAASCPMSKEHSVILIYCVTSGKLELTLNGHKGPIYSLHWNRDDYLLSASGDTTVKIWSPKSKGAQIERATLEHPCYIYTAKFHPNSANLLATAGYDNVIRIWMKEITDDDDEEDMQLQESIDKKAKKKNDSHLRYVMKHELVSHKSYINCLVFDIDGQLLFSGDNTGGIRVWEPHIQESPSGTPSAIPTSKQMFKNTLWYLKKKLEFKEIVGNPITGLHIHPGGRRLLVQCRSLISPGSILMIDLKLNLIMQTFSGIQSFRKTTGGCITPCGTYVFAGSQGKELIMDQYWVTKLHLNRM